MSQFRQLAERLHRLRETQQLQEEAELARVMQEESEVSKRIEIMAARRFDAAELRNGQASGLDMAAWNQYITALQIREREEKQHLEEVAATVDRQRGKVMLAYQDTRRWDTMAARLREMERRDLDIRMQKEADEMASQRRNRGVAE